MFGAEYSFNHFKPSSFNENPGAAMAEGTIDVQSFSTYAMYGLNSRTNLIMIIPYERWQQDVNVTNVHMRDVTIKGIGDVTIGARWLLKNQTTSDGHRLFAGLNISIPTGNSFDVELLSAEAQTTNHNHFAIGHGHFTSTVNFEYWHKLNSPILTGFSGAYNFALNESDVGFRSGGRVFLDAQATILKSLFMNSMPFIKLSYRNYSPDRWDGKDANNTGGNYIDGTAALFFTISDTFSLITFANFPIWRSLEGAQLDNFVFSFSFRKMLQ
ncbi:hypothetical protein ACFL67_02265 [candidate division KSB1 bacterium]